jgi:transketolase
MRNVFLDKLYDQMEIDESIFFLTADMGINLVEKFEDKFPKRFLNVGIAEQNLIGVASGLAESGMRPYVYTISNFLIHRCFEQIRNDIVLHNLPVVLIGTSTGYDNGPLGPTHHMLEDWGVISNLPRIKIYTPKNKLSAENIFLKTTQDFSPTYVRIPKGDGLEDSELKINLSNTENVVISYGSASKFGLQYAQNNGMRIILLEELGKESFQFLDQHISQYRQVTVVEDHFASTGMYSFVCQWANSRSLQLEVVSVSPSDYMMSVGLEFSDFLD